MCSFHFMLYDSKKLTHFLLSRKTAFFLQFGKHTIKSLVVKVTHTLTWLHQSVYDVSYNIYDFMSDKRWIVFPNRLRLLINKLLSPCFCRISLSWQSCEQQQELAWHTQDIHHSVKPLNARRSQRRRKIG